MMILWWAAANNDSEAVNTRWEPPFVGFTFYVPIISNCWRFCPFCSFLQLNWSSMFSPSHFAIGANPPLIEIQATVHLDGIFSPGSCRKLQPSTIQSTATLSIGGATRSGGSQSTTQSLWAWTAQSDAPNANCIAIFFYHTQDSVDSTPQWTNNRRRWRELRSDWRAEVEMGERKWRCCSNTTWDESVGPARNLNWP